MFKFKYMACIELRKRLCEKIKGKIFVANNEDSVTVTINAGRGIIYTKDISDFSEKSDIDYYIDSIEYGFRCFLKERFFY